MIYLLEDDDSIRELVCYSLEKTGNPARGFALPHEFYKALESELPELVLLDVMLPEEDGLTVLKNLRSKKRTADLPVIMLTAKGTEFDKVTALDLGADDYVTKPFGVMELVARVKALLRRVGRTPCEKNGDFNLGRLSVSTERHEVRVDGKEISLTYKEFELLVFLLENRGVVLTRDRILREVWDYEFDGENRTVDVHVRTLRQKLGEDLELIETVRGVGYKISAKES
ncbi:MAG: response regulator transcription factor [Clostridia bacterium]|nr:response regulator transcription factor [Clostridia bacterium]